MSYDALGRGALDYLPCRYGESKLLFRGPKRDLSEPYIAFVGTTETYGKFIETPFPVLVEADLGMTCVNFGQVTAGIDAYVNDPFVMKAGADAELTVVQIMGAQNMSNRFYSVHPRRNDRFLTAGAIMQTIYREVDFSQFNFTKHMLSHLHMLSPERFETVRQELQNAWMARMQFLLSQLKGKTILLWCAHRIPADDAREFDDDLTQEPLFITRHMIDTVMSHATSYVEVVASPDAQTAGAEGMVFGELDAPAAEQLLGPTAHREVADALKDALAKLL
ncbi:MAG: DUF6473 family protein [Pseudomonadota bacterium]